jgi:sugar/nucleoside kinase (ribokinase family)
MIVVIGSPWGRDHEGLICAAGPASQMALAAARTGRTVQFVGRTGDDPVADAVVLDLTRGGVGHVALLRDPATTTSTVQVIDEDGNESVSAKVGTVTAAAGSGAGTGGSDLDPADVDLGLRYLTDFQVVLLAEPSRPEVISVVVEAARWAEARLVLVVSAGDVVPDDLPADVVIFEAPRADPDDAFAEMVGAFVAALDLGVEPDAAFLASIARDGWTGVAVE